MSDMPENETLDLAAMRQICATATALEVQGRITPERAAAWRDYARRNCPQVTP